MVVVVNFKGEKRATPDACDRSSTLQAHVQRIEPDIAFARLSIQRTCAAQQRAIDAVRAPLEADVCRSESNKHGDGFENEIASPSIFRVRTVVVQLQAVFKLVKLNRGNQTPVRNIRRQLLVLSRPSPPAGSGLWPTRTLFRWQTSLPLHPRIS